MERKPINPTTKEEARNFAKIVLENEMQCTVKEIKYVGGGYFGFAYRADIDKSPYRVIIKACRTVGMCEQDANALNKLGEDTIIKVPKVYFTSLMTDEIPIDFLCMEFIDGKDCFTNFSQLLKSKKAKCAFADEITTALHHWHNITNDKFGVINSPCYDEWLDLYKPFAFDVLESARTLAQKGELEKKVIVSMERAWNAFDYIFSEKVETASLIHGDLNVMNIMADKHLKTTAIIDPLECKYADREYDLFQLRNLTGEKFGLYDMYKSKYPVSEKCDIKTSFYALYHEVYCFVSAGQKINLLLMPIVNRMNKDLQKAGYQT